MDFLLQIMLAIFYEFFVSKYFFLFHMNFSLPNEFLFPNKFINSLWNFLFQINLTIPYEFFVPNDRFFSK